MTNLPKHPCSSSAFGQSGYPSQIFSMPILFLQEHSASSLASGQSTSLSHQRCLVTHFEPSLQGKEFLGQDVLTPLKRKYCNITFDGLQLQKNVFNSAELILFISIYDCRCWKSLENASFTLSFFSSKFQGSFVFNVIYQNILNRHCVQKIKVFHSNLSYKTLCTKSLVFLLIENFI